MVLRRGKALVQQPFLAATNDANEYGRAHPYRGQPFRSSSTDVGQAACRCNFDMQYHVRAVPDDPREASEASGGAAEHSVDSSSPPLFFAWRSLSRQAKQVLLSLAAAMRAAHVADSYIEGPARTANHGSL